MAWMAPTTSIDWQQPWLAPLRHVGECVVARQRSGMSLPDALNLDGAPRRFVPHEALPEGEPYESYIARSAQVPTRENLHDFFNGLVWHAEPALKSRLNQLQAQAIGRDGIGPRRGALRDALTLFDENGALLEGPDAMLQALRQRDWQQLLVHQRALWREARLRIVGHALLAQLSVAPRKGLTAHVWVGDALSATAETWRAKPFLPLPVLGVPGWWPANQAPDFYGDAAVFRARREKPLAPVDSGASRDSSH